MHFQCNIFLLLEKIETRRPVEFIGVELLRGVELAALVELICCIYVFLSISDVNFILFAIERLRKKKMALIYELTTSWIRKKFYFTSKYMGSLF
jgi:hypothetical protein